MTKRSVKYYEEKGLISVKKDSNGYRNYTEQDVETLKRISVYRKLGIGIKDIHCILSSEDDSILLNIYQEKLNEHQLRDEEIKALKEFIDDRDATKANERMDYRTVENAIEALLPREGGNYFRKHFKPFLYVKIKTAEQKQALKNILAYCDETTLKIPFMMKLGSKIAEFIPNLKVLSPKYAEYKDAMERVNNRMCKELGLYYDTNYNLVIKK